MPRFSLFVLGLLAWSACTPPVAAQAPDAGAPVAALPPPSGGVAAPRSLLGAAFLQAWALQPEAQSLAARRDAVQANRRIARAWTPVPPAFEISGRTARTDLRRGGRELDAGLAIPLWLPGERGRSGALADADAATLESAAAAAQLRLAAALRSAYWAWQAARADTLTAQDQRAAAQALADDVARRVRAGDLARADGHQADGALAAAEVALARAQGAEAGAQQQWLSAMGTAALAGAGGVAGAVPPGGPTVPAGNADPAPPAEEPEPPPDTAVLPHPALREWQDRAEAARRAAELAEVQRRGNPELLVGTVRDREAAGDTYRNSVAVGVRVPFGSDDRHALRRAAAEAELREAEAVLVLETQRITAARDAARRRLDAARSAAAAAERRQRLAQETRTFFDKSFRLGGTDLPMRLRIEREAVEAERGAAAARIEQSAALSAWRQALGLLPD
ncbi:TolC family protein [uncultured Xylophilus sp.]|uniref:TolC family protein n=1 Tax=uncultured Xylophilus sp. TaxID=296832 RepID=UPI0025D951AE|nr:TolC family protein [uncultured Xylophilus sp.]